MKTLAALAMLLGLALVSCDKPADKTNPASTGSGAAANPAASAADEGVATEEDFEDEAEQKITSANAEEELDKLEKEIGK